MRASVGEFSTVEVAFEADDEPMTADGDVTVTVLDETGAAVVAPSTATATPVGSYTFRLTPEHLDRVRRLTATWTGVFASHTASKTTQIDVAGDRYFSITDLRELPGMEDDGKFLVSELVELRDWVESRIERTCRTSFVERPHRWSGSRSALRCDRDWGWGIDTLRRDMKTVRQVTLDDSPLDAAALAEIDVADGFVFGGQSIQSPWRKVQIDATAVWPDGLPPDLRAAALGATRALAMSARGRSGIPERASSISNNDGSMTRFYNQRPDDEPTGIREYDEVIVGWARRTRLPGMA